MNSDYYVVRILARLKEIEVLISLAVSGRRIYTDRRVEEKLVKIDGSLEKIEEEMTNIIRMSR